MLDWFEINGATHRLGIGNLSVVKGWLCGWCVVCLPVRKVGWALEQCLPLGTEHREQQPPTPANAPKNQRKLDGGSSIFVDQLSFRYNFFHWLEVCGVRSRFLSCTPIPHMLVCHLLASIANCSLHSVTRC